MISLKLVEFIYGGSMEGMKERNTDRHPNILWICTDQQRFDTLGCYGNKFVSTPALDGLASGAALFENAFAQSPVCSPSRASFLTGRYPVTCRMRQNGADIPETEILVSKLFHDRGYTCGLSGKLHIRACNPSSGCTEMESRIDDGYEEFHWSHDTGAAWGLNNEYYRWLHDEHGTTYHTEVTNESKWVSYGMPIEQHQSYWCAEKAVDFIEKNNGNPWFFSVNMYDPHHPFDPPKELLDRYMDRLSELPLPRYFDGEENTKTVWQRQDHTGAYNHHAGHPFSEMTELDHRMQKAAYYAMCDMIDMQVARMIDALRSSGQYENTIILFHSDHGELLGDHGIYLKGPFFYDCSIKVPLIISWPGHIPAKRYGQLVELMDIPETLLDLCGFGVIERMQGKSLLPMFKNENIQIHDDVYCEYLNAMPWHTDPKAFASMVRTDKWKLVVSHSGNHEGELYDLTDDPGEMKNLFGNDDYKDIRHELYSRLLEQWARMPDPVPVRKSDW